MMAKKQKDGKTMSNGRNYRLNVGHAIQQQVLIHKIAAGESGWLESAKTWLSNPDNQLMLARILGGTGIAGAGYGISSLFDDKGKYRLERALASLGLGTGVVGASYIPAVEGQARKGLASLTEMLKGKFGGSDAPAAPAAK